MIDEAQGNNTFLNFYEIWMARFRVGKHAWNFGARMWRIPDVCSGSGGFGKKGLSEGYAGLEKGVEAYKGGC